MWINFLNRAGKNSLLIAALLFFGLAARAQSTPTITVNGQSVICPGDSVALTASQGDSYQWLNFGFPIFGATSQTYWVKQSGQYTVIVTTTLVPLSSATTAITVSAPPTVFINSSSTGVCPGTQISLSLSGNNNSGNAASFNVFMATNAHVSIPHQSQLNGTPLTVEAWVRPQQSGVNAGIVSKLPISTSLETGYGFKQTSNNRFQFVIGREGNEVAAESNTFNLGPWYHLTGTYDGTTVKIYVNGVLHGSNTVSATINSTANLIVGNLNSMSAAFKGLVDELRIWNQINTAADIQCNYKLTVSPGAANLKGYWRMNETSAGSTPDITTYGDNGAIVNGATLTTSGAGINNLYVWDAAPGITNIYGACQSFVPTSTIIYKATATNVAGCTASDTEKVEVFPAGQIYNVTGSGVYCTGTAGRPVGLDGSETGVFYQLKKGAANVGGLVAGTGNPLTLALVTTAGTYTVIATNSNCTNSMAGNAVVTVSPSPQIATGIVTNEVCNAGTTGGVNITVASGTPSFAYQWSNGAITEDIQNVAAGNYNVTVTDVQGCTASDTFTITEPTPVLVSANTTNVLCNGANTGAVTLTTGGTPPYTFAWSNSATTQNISNIPAGNYSVAITDNAGCTEAGSYTITQPAAIVLSAATTHVSCNGGSNGAIDLAVSGGTGAYSYSWSNNATTQDLNNLGAGSYTVTVTDGNGCVKTATYTISEPQQLAANATGTNISCYNANNGSVDLTVTGGTAPYTYSWNNSATTEDLSNLGAGSYSVTVTDAHGCTATASASISEPAPLAMSGVVTNIQCYGNNTGAINITVTGGTMPYSYSWSNSATTEDLSNLAAGTYSVTVTDAHGCTANATYTVTQPAMLVVTHNITTPSCFGNTNGAIDLTVAGPAGPFSYSWSNNATTEDISGIGAGSYTVVISYNGCTTTKTYNVEQPAALTANATATDASCGNANSGSVSLSVAGGTLPYSYLWNNNATTQNLSNIPAGSYNVTISDAHGCTATASATVNAAVPVTLSGTATNVSCNGANNGSIDLTVLTGTAPYSYSWSNNATTEDLGSLGAGTYTVTVTDSKNCSATSSFTITQPTALAASATATNASCNGGNNGTVSLNVTGGTAPYSYNWGGGVTTQNRSNLSAGTYSVSVTDANGCTAAASATVSQPAALSANTTVTNVSCNGNNDGAISLNVTGGTAPYSYNWGGAVTTQNRNNLSGGTYNVAITDAHGCTATASATVVEPAVLGVSGVVNNVTISGGSNGGINITITGGTTPYTYSWSNNATTEDFTNIQAGSYSVTVTDAHGCTATGSYTVTQPAALVVSGNATNSTCAANSGTITISVSGGIPPYSYNWGGGITTQNRTGLAGGTYTVTVTDFGGATATQSFTVGQSSTVTGSAVVTNVTCYGNNNGSIVLTPSGGTAPYSYVWENNSTNKDRNNLAAGTYTVTIKDANNCTATLSFNVTQPVALNVTGIKTDVSCKDGNNGAIDITVTGGTGPYTYSWNNNNNYNYNGPLGWLWWLFNYYNNNNNNIVATEDRNNLEAGSYTVTVTDANGCTTTATYTVTEPSSALYANGSVTNVSCYGSNTGAVNISVYGGNSPYSYSWSNNATTQDIANVAAGSYTLTLTDANGCVKTSNYTVSQPSAALSATAVVNNTCYGQNNGSINQAVTGGTPPYSYNWANSYSASQDRYNLAAGTYSVTITDNKGCSIVKTYTVSQPSSSISISGVVTNVVCKNGDNGAIDITVTGGSGPYTYNWHDGCSNNYYNNNHGHYCHSWWNNWCYYHNNNNNGYSTSQDLTDLEAGTYVVTVTDANGCTQTASFTVTEPNTSVNAGISVSPVVTVTNGAPYTIYLGYGPQSVTLTAAASGGTAPYTYSWSGQGINNSTSQSVSVSPTTDETYTLTVTDAKGCSKTVTRTIYVIDARANNNKIKLCHNGNTKSVAVSAVAAHLNHGDQLGSCNENNNNNWNKPDPEGEEHEEELQAVQQSGTNMLSDMNGKHIDVYPSPTDGAFTLQLPMGETNAQVMITDGQGRLIERRVVSGINTIGFDLSHVAQGMYNVHVTMGDEVYNSRVIKK